MTTVSDHETPGSAPDAERDPHGIVPDGALPRDTDDPHATARDRTADARGTAASDAFERAAAPSSSPGPLDDGTGTVSQDAADRPHRPARPRTRVSTVVWGLVLIGIGAQLLAVAAGLSVDLELTSIGLLTLAGLGLLIGSVTSGLHHRRRREPAR